MNTTILRFVLAGLLSLPALIAMADDQPANAAPPPASASNESTLRQQRDDANNKLEAALRSYTLLQTENDQLKSQQKQANAEIDKLRHDKAELEARLAAPAAPPAGTNDLAAQLAETTDKLNTVLRSYSLLQTETDELKASAAKSVADTQAAANKSASESAMQISSLYDQLRQTQARAAALAAENSQLRTKLALQGPPPGSALGTPARPGTPAAVAAATPAAQPAPVPQANPAVAPAPRQHVVVEGDTLAKIARQYYGDANRWDEILEANRDVIKNENVLPVGATLRIP